jgi:hypothetical protein
MTVTPLPFLDITRLCRPQEGVSRDASGSTRLANEIRYGTTATQVTDPGAVARVVEGFRAKYDARDVAQYYPHPDVAIEVPLG